MLDKNCTCCYYQPVAFPCREMNTPPPGTPLTSPSPPGRVKVIFLVSWFTCSTSETIRCWANSMFFGNESVFVTSWPALWPLGDEVLASRRDDGLLGARYITPAAPMNTAAAKGGSLRALNLHGEVVAMMIISWWLSVCKLWHLRTASGAKSHRWKQQNNDVVAWELECRRYYLRFAIA